MSDLEFKSMFDGVPVEHFHRFISTPSSTIPPNSSLIHTSPISTSTNLNFLSFDPILFPPLHPHHHQTLYQSNHFVQTPPTPTRDRLYNDSQGKVDEEIDINEPWSNDEVIQLLRIKSSSENWFKDLTWDHVSRKLAEMGYKRSSEKCKEKFEEETCRSFSGTIGYNKSNSSSSSSRYLISEELDEHHHHHLCNDSDQNTHHHVTIESSENVNHQEQPQVQETDGGEQNLEAPGQKCDFEKDPTEIIMTQPSDEDDAQVTKSKKRKRKHKKFKMVKGLCVDLVNKMMAQQEELHKKLLEDMANRDEEKKKREEAWRKEEMERVEMEIHIREHEQEMAKDRQSTITQFLNKITSFDKKIQIPSNIINLLQDLQANSTNKITKIHSSDNDITENPSQDHQAIIAKDDTGKRWPRDEVLALINIKCNLNNGHNEQQHQEYGGNNKLGGGRGSLWERISQEMLELGYKRSAKRCKEKWENINKYFRKTKDGSKKRSLESRTCPYYHELSKLYNQDKVPSSLISNSTGLSSQELMITAKITPEN